MNELERFYGYRCKSFAAITQWTFSSYVIVRLSRVNLQKRYFYGDRLA